MKYGGSFILISIMTEKKFYTQEDLLVAMSKLPENEAKNILENMKINTILDFINTSNNEQREQLKDKFSETIHRELDIYNGFNKLYNMLPVVGCKMYTDEGVEQNGENNENVSSKAELEDK